MYRYAYRHPSSVLVLCRHHILEARDIICFSLFILIAWASLCCSDFLFVPAWSVQFFLIRCWIPDFHCLIQSSIVLTLKLTPHIFRAVPPWCSPRHTVISWLLSHFSIAKLRQADYRKYRWHYLRHKKFGNLPHFSFLRLQFSPFRFQFSASLKVGIPFFLLEIICLCSFLLTSG